MKQLIETVRVSADTWRQQFEIETHHGLEAGGFHVGNDRTADSPDTHWRLETVAGTGLRHRGLVTPIGRSIRTRHAQSDESWAERRLYSLTPAWWRRCHPASLNQRGGSHAQVHVVDVEYASPGGAIGVSRWHTARSAASTTGRMLSNIGVKTGVIPPDVLMHSPLWRQALRNGGAPIKVVSTAYHLIMSEHTHYKAVLDDVLRLGRALRQQQSPTSYKSPAETIGVVLALQRMEARDHDRRSDG